MAQSPLAPPPPEYDPGWMYLLWKRVSSAGQTLWSYLDFTGSNLTDIATRNHADLQNINTAAYTHLTSTEAALVTGTKTANTFLAGPSSGAPALATFRAPVLASADFASQGTTTTLLHGNAAGNPSFAVVTPSDASGNTSGSGNFALVDSPVFTTQISTPAIKTASGALTVTPAAGSGINLVMSTTGDFAVNTNQLYVDTSAGTVGIGIATPGYRLVVANQQAKTSTTRQKTVLIGTSEGDAGNAFGVEINITGGASDAVRLFELQTASFGLSNAGNLKLQSYGGNVGIGGGNAIPTSLLEVRGAGTTTGKTLSVTNSSAVENLYVLDNGEAYVRGSFGIGSASPTSQFQIGTPIAGSAQTKTISARNSVTTDFANLSHLSSSVATARASSIISASASGDWVNNFIQYMVHGSTFAANNYLNNLSKSNDSGWGFLLSQGGEINGFGILTYSAKPLVLGTNNLARVFIDSSGSVVIGATAITTIGNSNLLQLAGTTAATNSIGVSAWSADALGSRIELGKSRGATVGTNTIVTSGDVLGSVTGYGANGTTFTNAASIVIRSDGTPGATNDMPGAIDFYTTPDGSGTLGLALTIDQAKLATFAGAVTATNFSAWAAYTPTRTGWTDVGSPTVTARFCQVRNVCQFQIKVIPGVTVATVAGTSYVSLPATAAGIGGDASMQDLTTFISIGNCVIDVANSRVYVPAQAATADSLIIAGWFEV